ncbi:hypothetical protein FOXG_17213 [Fusarium oxysporum f. sp. lycopersici 4287]|uniref:Zn(2)-C6 fungal-type domain-containing protein n=1 Tax=Fusarium oxysporum f. sp. lycopersici (strain 4287 / CBS 123668 / FGSC 9935 / NRRL 34936) TaxID=426428 RepID=A0A0J9WVT6_FUSO4|nr:hypothetical protein FOXG_17213 [Fusarium oxysporum f. sp. lycopersici 4287]KAJ9418962.1 hypothetical protein QL093DRAFT_2395585 [Fusarium oxysporum]KNB20097.1 hypothetical protein FOXG_17213 [Fusarium oxysporum f. sp. lycopersici 4287]
MPPDSSPETLQTPRSCDRCFSLKTQCDLAQVCGRCKRLGLECTNIRPVRPKGRPRKSERSSEPPQTVDLSTAIGRVLDQTLILQLDNDLASSLVEHIVSTHQAHGLYAAILTSPPSLPVPTRGLASGPTSYPSKIPTELYSILTPSIIYSLLSIALDIQQPSSRLPSHPSSRINSNSLRTAALTHIPRVLSPYDPKVSDALSLLFLSHAWCFQSERIRDSVRWWTFAHVIIDDVIKTRVSLPFPCALQDLEQRACLGIALQDSILSILHYNRAVSLQQKDDGPLFASIEPPRANTKDAEGSRATGFSNLFGPLIRLANAVVQEPKPSSRTWRDIYDDIEEYYIVFPSELLRFNDLKFLYQAEAMTWMHGLFIILYIGRDPIDIILKPDLLEGETLRQVLGHSLLFGEILHSINRLGDDLSYLSPAVVFFLIISSAVQIAALGMYLNNPADESAMPGIAIEVSTTSSTQSVPQKLMDSSRAHLHLLSAISTQCKRYDSLLLVEIQKLLASCYNCVQSSSCPAQPILATTLMLYRWTGRGTGIYPLEPTVAYAEWLFSQPPEHDIHQYLSGHNEVSRQIVNEVCSPASRICEEGYFDLSIVIS